MYKSLEISQVIGAFYLEGYIADSFSIAELKNIILEMHEYNQFISIDLSYQALNKALCIAKQDAPSGIKIEKITIPQDNEVWLRFVREYYKLDVDTRAELSQIVKQHIRK